MTITAPRSRDAEHVDPEALIEEAWQRARRRRRRQRIAALSVLALVAIGALGWAALSNGGTSARGGRARSAGLAVGRGTVRYLYTRAFIAPPEHAIPGSSAGTATIENDRSPPRTSPSTDRAPATPSGHAR